MRDMQSTFFLTERDGRTQQNFHIHSIREITGGKIDNYLAIERDFIRGLDKSSTNQRP